MEEEKFKDLLEDEELKSLRLAALATKRKKEQDAAKSKESADALPINSIVTSSVSECASSQIPFVQSDRNAYTNNYLWRKQNQSSRRRAGPFPKNNTRSNLIVISPVSTNDDKGIEQKTPALILPQHRWCNSGNEDSLSPKTLRRTGPTRFNRHDSDEESSESEYENDNDSGSNETFLQDEPAEHFSRSSPDSDSVSDGAEKKRRLSFQNLDSEIKPDAFDKNETTSIYNLLKNPSSENKPDNYSSVQNQSGGRHAWSHSVENDFNSYKQFNSGNSYVSEPLDSTDKFATKEVKSLVVNNVESCVETNNFRAQSSDSTWKHTDNKTVNSYYSSETSTTFENPKDHGITDRKQKSYIEKRRMSSEAHSLDWQRGEGFQSNKSYFSKETAYNAADSKNYKDNNMQILSENDLRYELKKRNLNQEKKSDSTNEKMESKRYSQHSTWDRNRLENSYERNVNDVSYVNSYGNREECSNFNGRQHERSLSKERSRQGRCSSRERSRFGYSSGSERKKRDRSSSLSRSRHERSRSRGRIRSSSQDRRIERSSSQGRTRHGNVQDLKQNRSVHSYSEERDGYSLSRNKNYHGDNFHQDKNRLEYNSSQNKSRYDRNSSQYRSRREHSSSSGSRYEHSTSRDRELGISSSRSRSKRERSSSRDRRRYERSSSREKRRAHSSSQEKNKHDRSSSRSRHESTDSQDSRYRQRRSYDRNRREDSSSRNESDEGHSSNRRRRYSKNSPGEKRNAYKKHSSDWHRSRHSITSNQEKNEQGCLSSQEKVKDSDKIIELRKSHNFEGIRENCELDKHDTKETKLTSERSRSHSGSEERKRESNRIPLKNSRRKDSSYKSHCSRSHSSSSMSSSSSSSSSYSTKPKIRSVSSVVKPAPSKTVDVLKGEMFNEIKSDVCSTLNKKNTDVGDHNKVSGFKCSRMDVDFKASDNSKRVPVHMRLGVLPRKRVIQMPKDVEAAFVNSSSSGSDNESVNVKCKRQNIRIVTDVCDDKSEFDIEKKPLSKEKVGRSPDLSQEKSKRLKIKR